MDDSKSEPAFAALADGKMMIARRPSTEERSCSSGDADVPLVIEAVPGQSRTALRGHLAQHSTAVLQALHESGALLLRGLSVSSTREFEEVLFGIRGLSAMRGYFMAELGRVLVPGSTRVFHTNAFLKTGGTFYFGGFHAENYYSSDVPSFIAFCCLDSPWLGGETGIVQMARAYDELGADLKAKLEREPSLATSWEISEIARRYDLDDAAAQRLCEDAGFTVIDDGEQKRALLYKPTVVVHPVTGKRALHFNVSGELAGFDDRVRARLRGAFAGPAWALHRLGWRHPEVMELLDAAYKVSNVLHKPRVVAQLAREFVLRPLQARRKAARSSEIVAHSGAPEKLGARLTDSELDELAAAIARHTNMIKWRRGDILLLDNLQTLHNGMPGLGSRRIEAALCNPLALRWPVSTGILEVSPSPGHQPIYERIMARP